MMSRILALVGAVALLLGTVAPVVAGDVYVRGHVRRDGTYVAPHWRSAPDGNPYNNWSTYPNVNPYTGQQGTRRPEQFQQNDGGLSGSGDSGLSGQRGRPLYGR